MKKKKNGYWTKELVQLEALKYTTRTAWQDGSKGAYLAALRKGWLDECCRHMVKGAYLAMRLTEADIIAKLPSYIKIKFDTFVDSKSPATFVDSEFGEYTCTADWVINKGRMHPDRLKIVKRHLKDVPVSIVQARLPEGTQIVPETYTKVSGKATFIRGEHKWEAFVYNVIWGHTGPTTGWINKPKIQQKIIDLLSSVGVASVPNQKVLTEENKYPKEIDVWVNHLKFGIETHGLYWHCDAAPKVHDKYYHADKWKIADKLGIQLLQFFEDEVRDQWDIVTSIIKSKLGVHDKTLQARQCDVRPINYKEKTIFFKQNHLQGDCPSAFSVGLYHEGVLVQALSLRKNKKYGIELARFATKMGHSVRFGFGRLMKYARQWSVSNNYKTMVSYCDLRISTGKVYEAYGFRFDGQTVPDLFWTDRVRRFSRQLSWGKSKEEMARRKLNKIYGTGHFRYLLDL
jgi:hypothetical protein